MNGGPRLIVIHPGQARGRVIPLRPGPTLIGRAPGLAWARGDAGGIDDGEVSRHHARAHWTGTVVELDDLGSSNGTWVNGNRIRRRMRLADGDHVRMGSWEFRFSSGDNANGPHIAGGANAGRDRIDYRGGVHARGDVIADRGGQIAGRDIVHHREERYEVAEEIADTVNPFRAIVRGGIGGALTLVGLVLSIAGAGGFAYVVYLVFARDMDSQSLNPDDHEAFDILATELIPGIPLVPASFAAIAIGGLLSALGSAITRRRR